MFMLAHESVRRRAMAGKSERRKKEEAIKRAVLIDFFFTRLLLFLPPTAIWTLSFRWQLLRHRWWWSSNFVVACACVCVWRQLENSSQRWR